MDTKQILNWKNRIYDLFNKYRDVYIFGAGRYAKKLIPCILEWGMHPKGIVVSNPEVEFVNSIPVYKFEDNKHYGGALILALHSRMHKEILSKVSGKFESVVTLPDALFNDLAEIRNIYIRNENGWYSVKDIHNACELLKRKTVVLQRTGGMGDVLNVEPICRKLKEYGFQVGISTRWERLFIKNESVDFYTTEVPNNFLRSRTIYISLDNVYEYSPYNHILDSYVNCVKQFLPELDIPSEEKIPIYDKKLIHKRNSIIKKICMNVEASDWKARMYERKKMKEFAGYLKSAGYDIYEIGSNDAHYLEVGEKCFGLPLHDTVSLMSQTDLYVGFDNGLSHLAQAIRLPVFVLFGCVCPLYRIHDWSRARVLWKNTDELSCAGCYHRRQIPCMEPSCIHDVCHCMDWSVDEVIYAFEHLKYNEPPVLHKEMFNIIWDNY